MSQDPGLLHCVAKVTVFQCHFIDSQSFATPLQLKNVPLAMAAPEMDIRLCGLAAIFRHCKYRYGSALAASNWQLGHGVRLRV
jgi:hypothetical protein